MMKRTVDVEALGRAVAAVQDAWDAGQPAADTHEVIRQRLAWEAAVASEHGRGRGAARPPFILAVALGAALMALAVVYFKISQPDLSFSVGDPPQPGQLAEMLVVPAERQEALPVRFSEGTTILLQPAARGRVVRVGPRGADVNLDAGRARFQVTHRRGSSWSVHAGPFAVQITGTKFEVEYDPLTEQFALDLVEGRVVISGCGFGDGRVVQVGERIRARCPARLGAAPALGARRAEPEEGAAPGNPAEGPPASAPPRDSKGKLPAPSSLWAELARRGRYQEAYGLVRRSFERQCRERPADEVWLLGDVARLTGHATEARQAYRTLRGRFPATPAAADAAFALGRIALELDGDGRGAERWFQTAFGERPSGALGLAALGRVMELRTARGDYRAAADSAREYLRRDPNGPLARQATSLVDGRASAERQSGGAP